MRRLSSLVLLFLLLPGAVSAAGAPKPYVGLFADDGHSVISVFSSGGFTQFEVWLWWLPGPEGIAAVECGIVYPWSVISGAMTVNPEVSNILPGCCYRPDECACIFNGCQTEWVWLFRQICFLMSTEPAAIRVAGYRGAGAIQVATCELGYPVEPATVLTHLHLNQEGAYAVESASWGAIKALCR